jgi:hypothetical protein
MRYLDAVLALPSASASGLPVDAAILEDDEATDDLFDDAALEDDEAVDD